MLAGIAGKTVKQETIYYRQSCRCNSILQASCSPLRPLYIRAPPFFPLLWHSGRLATPELRGRNYCLPECTKGRRFCPFEGTSQ
jgi:hypothetical protein